MDSSLDELRLSSFALLIFASLGSGGCRHLGPRSITADRIPYNEAIATSWKEQTLLNIVKLRYMDTPFFLDVPQITSGYQIAGSCHRQRRHLPAGQQPGLLCSATRARPSTCKAAYQDRPTISYQPQTGSQFIRNLTNPINPGFGAVPAAIGLPGRHRVRPHRGYDQRSQEPLRHRRPTAARRSRVHPDRPDACARPRSPATSVSASSTRRRNRTRSPSSSRTRTSTPTGAGTCRGPKEPSDWIPTAANSGSSSAPRRPTRTRSPSCRARSPDSLGTVHLRGCPASSIWPAASHHLSATPGQRPARRSRSLAVPRDPATLRRGLLRGPLVLDREERFPIQAHLGLPPGPPGAGRHRGQGEPAGHHHPGELITHSGSSIKLRASRRSSFLQIESSLAGSR